MEATRLLPTEPVAVETPLERTQGRRLLPLDPVLVPVLRAGLGLLPAFLQLLPTAKVGHLGLYRDHDSLVPVPYYRNFPPLLEQRHVFVLDPMLATGGSASEARAAAEGGRRQEAHPGLGDRRPRGHRPPEGGPSRTCTWWSRRWTAS